MSESTTTFFSDDLLARIRNGAAQRDAQRELPFALINEIKATGFGARRLAQEHGGAGTSLRETMAAAITLAEADPNVAHIWRNHHVVLERVLNTASHHPLTQRLRQQVANGAMIGQANTELGHPTIGGDNVFFTRLAKHPSESGFVLNGKKFYSTGALFADWVYLPVAEANGSRVLVVLPKDRAGLVTVDDWFGMGQRLTGSGTTLLENVHVAEDEVLYAADTPPHHAAFGSTIAQLFLTSVIAGIVQAIANDSAALLSQRKRNFYYAPTASASNDPILLAALGEREADAFAAQAIVAAAAQVADTTAIALRQQTADAAEQAQAASAAAAKAKIAVERIAHHAATALFDVAGASSTLAQLNLDRHWRNIRTISSHNPSSHKAYALGNLRINQVPLPTKGFF